MTKETKRKLSIALKRSWAARKGGAWPVMSMSNGAAPSLTSLFSAAIILSTDNGAALKQAICDQAEGETIVAALEKEQREGTNLQSRIRKELTKFIQEAL